MSNVSIDYIAVYKKIAKLEAAISDELLSMKHTYKQALPLINDLDSATDALLRETVERNRKKAQVTAEVLTNLL